MAGTLTVERPKQHKTLRELDASPMSFLSVCSGIEAASVAFKPLGWQPVGFSEIEPFPCSVLAHHYPNVKNYGDLTKQEEWQLPAFDVLCGGTPCQGFSVAGKRGGLADARSQLVWHFLEIARRQRPRWVLWENVPGVLSSEGGADFGAVLGRLGECGYGFAYRVLDAQYFGVAQRRRRVFVVGYLGDWRPAAAVLFERESMSGNPAPSREAGQRAAPTISARTKGGGGLGTDCDLDGGVIAAPITASYGKQVDSSDTSKGPPNLIPLTVGALSDGAHNGGGSTGKTPIQAELSLALPTKQQRLDPAQETLIPVGSFFDEPVAIAQNQRGELRTSEIAPQLTTGGGKPGEGYPAIAFNLRGREGGANVEQTDVASLRAASGGSSRTYVGVRRLTPRECERLQGFPDDYTLVPHRGKPAADGPRYKALGNSWAVPCARWIGERIALVEAMVRANFGEVA